MTVILNRAVEEHEPSSVFALFSGGDDSLCSTALASQHPSFTAAVHINTGIGIEETREFVRETCREQNWPLIELHPDDKTYRDLVLDKGFPRGPKSHSTMYYYLKQRQIHCLVREHKTHHYDRIGLVTGIRSSESTRRMEAAMAKPIHRQGAQLWINPIIDWSKRRCLDFLREIGISRNPVSRELHRSGECLCGALANRHEIELIEMFYPEAAAEIHALEDEVRAKGLIDCVWAGRPKGPGMTWADLEEETGQPEMLCRDCTVRGQ